MRLHVPVARGISEKALFKEMATKCLIMDKHFADGQKPRRTAEISIEFSSASPFACLAGRQESAVREIRTLRSTWGGWKRGIARTARRYR
jgi:hypothetical protein